MVLASAGYHVPALSSHIIVTELAITALQDKAYSLTFQMQKQSRVCALTRMQCLVEESHPTKYDRPDSAPGYVPLSTH